MRPNSLPFFSNYYPRPYINPYINNSYNITDKTIKNNNINYKNTYNNFKSPQKYSSYDSKKYNNNYNIKNDSHNSNNVNHFYNQYEKLSSNKNKSQEDTETVFEILGIKLHQDDLLLLGLILFLYTEGVKDEFLFIILILLLLT